jgi:fatty acid desaturase
MQTYVAARLSAQEGHALWLALHEEVKRERLLAPAAGTVLARLAALAVLFAAALWLAWFGEGWVELAAAYGALALLIAQFAFIGHDAGHGGISGRPRADRMTGQASMTLITGLAFDEWIGRHRAHHRYCQDEERDPDMAVGLVVSLTERSRRAKGAFGRLLTRHQAAHVWLLSFFFGHSQRLLSEVEVLKNVRQYPLDALFLAAHFALWIVLPLLLEVPASPILLAYLVPLTLLGPYLAAIFWVNHIGMPLVRRVEDFSFFEHQLVTSRTITNPPAWNWLFGGLNFQIEHHLFPQVPSASLAALQPIVRRHFARHGIPYETLSWRGAVRAVAAHFRAVGEGA